MERLYTPKEAAAKLGFTPEHLRTLADEGKIAVVRFGKKGGGRRYDVEGFLATNLKRTPTEPSVVVSELAQIHTESLLLLNRLQLAIQNLGDVTEAVKQNGTEAQTEEPPVV